VYYQNHRQTASIIIPKSVYVGAVTIYTMIPSLPSQRTKSLKLHLTGDEGREIERGKERRRRGAGEERAIQKDRQTGLKDLKMKQKFGTKK